jgi:hypothetical protein
MLNFTSDQWVIVALIFVLGLLVGGFLFSGGGRKWKHRYNSEVDRRSELEKTHAPVAAAPLAAAPLRSDGRDTNRDGVVDTGEAVRGDRPVAGFMDKVLGRDRDRDGDGIADRKE